MITVKYATYIFYAEIFEVQCFYKCDADFREVIDLFCGILVFLISSLALCSYVLRILVLFSRFFCV